MAAVPVTISGVLFDKYGRTGEPVTLMGMASITGVGVGGGPIIPPGGGGTQPPQWPVDPGYGYPERPVDPGYGIPGPPYPGHKPPEIWGGGNQPFPTPPIHIPPLPPGTEQPQPGDPTTPLPPPAGQAGWPVQPIAVPPYIVVNYPGVGPVVVAPPAPPSA